MTTCERIFQCIAIIFKTQEMKNPQIRYKDIMSLGFTEDTTPCDQVYFDEYGFEYRIYQLQLTDTIYLEWQKETRLCKLVRIDHPDKGNIKGVIDIEDLNHLKQIINFFSDTADYKNSILLYTQKNNFCINSMLFCKFKL